jgi:serine/threonine-protein kinase
VTQDVFGIVGTMQGGSFRVERAVAEGGFSVIYRAQHGAFRAPVALKCLKVPGDLTVSERASYLEKFREEAEILFRLSATISEVVRPLHVDQLTLQDGRFAPFLALEWLQGEALDEMIDHRRRNGQAPVGLFKLTKLLAPVARGLARAHRFPGPAGTISIVHRDIKPQNLFVATVAGVETVKILDFGIATAIMAAERGVGLDKVAAETDPVRAFTPRYASPEQWEPERWGAVGPWTDVWGLAITMVEVLAGRAALEGSQDDMRRRVFDTHSRPSPRSLGVVIPDEAESAFIRALAVDPRRRTRTVEAFWTELEAALRLRPSLSRRDDRRDTGRMPVAGPSLSGRPLTREETDEAASVPSGRPSLPQPSSAPAEWRGAPPTNGPRSEGDRIALAATLIDPARAERSSAVPDLQAAAPPSTGSSDRQLLEPEESRLLPERDAGLASGPADHAVELPAAPALDIELATDARELASAPIEQGIELAGPGPSEAASLQTSAVNGAGPAGDGAAGRGGGSSVVLEAGGGAADAGEPLELDIDPRPSAALPRAPVAATAVAPAANPAATRAPGAPGTPAHPAPLRLMSTRPRRAGLGALALPLQLIAVGLIIAIIDVVIARVGGTELRIGPMRPIWAGALLFVAGTALTFWRLFADEQDR